jgi:hypothetical protein
MLILGYTTREHLLLDLDETSLLRVVSLAKQLMDSYPDIGDCLVVETSTPSFDSYLKYDDKGRPWEKWVYQNFHLVFDASVGYDRCVAIIDALVDLGVLAPEYKQIRMFRGDMTLRVSAKWLHHRVIPPPRIVKYLFNQHASGALFGITRYWKMNSIGASISSLDHASPPKTRRTDRPPQQEQPSTPP